MWGHGTRRHIAKHIYYFKFRLGASANTQSTLFYIEMMQPLVFHRFMQWAVEVMQLFLG